MSESAKFAERCFKDFTTEHAMPISRRLFLGSAAGAATLSSFPAAAALPSRYLDLNNPEDALTAMIKMRGSLEPVDCPHWYEGTIYGILPGKAPIPMVDFEGSEIDYYERQPDGSYYAYGATVSFFKDTRTGEFIDTFENPITGKVNKVEPNSISVKAHYIYSIYGMKRSDDPTPLGNEPIIQKKLKWSESGPHTWLTMRRQYPANYPIGEHQIVQGATAELYDPDVVSVAATGSPTYMSPWLKWMDMKGHEGHTIWAGPAHKLQSIEQYPKHMLEKMEKYFPHKLTAKPSK